MKRIMFGVVALSLTLAACGPSDEEMLTQIELASIKTQQAWTPVPSQTPRATYTPLPTLVPLPVATEDNSAIAEYLAFTKKPLFDAIDTVNRFSADYQEAIVDYAVSGDAEDLNLIYEPLLKLAEAHAELVDILPPEPAVRAHLSALAAISACQTGFSLFYVHRVTDLSRASRDSNEYIGYCTERLGEFGVEREALEAAGS